MTVTVTNLPISLHEVLAKCHPGVLRRCAQEHDASPHETGEIFREILKYRTCPSARRPMDAARLEKALVAAASNGQPRGCLGGEPGKDSAGRARRARSGSDFAEHRKCEVAT
jgi:hypothetical protein